jgi:hypothetical protein
MDGWMDGLIDVCSHCFDVLSRCLDLDSRGSTLLSGCDKHGEIDTPQRIKTVRYWTLFDDIARNVFQGTDAYGTNRPIVAFKMAQFAGNVLPGQAVEGPAVNTDDGIGADVALTSPRAAYPPSSCSTEYLREIRALAALVKTTVKDDVKLSHIQALVIPNLRYVCVCVRKNSVIRTSFLSRV